MWEEPLRNVDAGACPGATLVITLVTGSRVDLL